MRVRYLVSGRVQGVGFRQFVAEEASRLAIAGWVRNLPDGRVEAEAEGNAEEISRFEQILARGPALSRVDQVQTVAAGTDELSLVFAIRR